MRNARFIAVNITYLAFYAPALVERFERLAMGAEKAGECRRGGGVGGGWAIFDCCNCKESANEIYDGWRQEGVPKRAFRLYSSKPDL